jgi:hypothetical protein
MAEKRYDAGVGTFIQAHTRSRESKTRHIARGSASALPTPRPPCGTTVYTKAAPGRSAGSSAKVSAAAGPAVSRARMPARRAHRNSLGCTPRRWDAIDRARELCWYPVLHGGASRPAFPPPFKVHGHSIEAISELEQLLADLQKPRLPRELPDFFGPLTVILRSRPLCVAHYGPPVASSPRHETTQLTGGFHSALAQRCDFRRCVAFGPHRSVPVVIGAVMDRCALRRGRPSSPKATQTPTKRRRLRYINSRE